MTSEAKPLAQGKNNNHHIIYGGEGRPVKFNLPSNSKLKQLSDWWLAIPKGCSVDFNDISDFNRHLEVVNDNTSVVGFLLNDRFIELTSPNYLTVGGITTAVLPRILGEYEKVQLEGCCLLKTDPMGFITNLSTAEPISPVIEVRTSLKE